MSTTTPATAVPADAATDRAAASVWPLRIAGGLLVLTPLLVAGGFATSPPQASDSGSDYAASLGADPVITGISAAFLHYGWVALVFGAFAAVAMVRGRRGRGLTTVGAAATAFGAVQMSGLLLSDHYLASMSNRVGPDVAGAVLESLDAGVPWVQVWLLTGKVFGLLGPAVLMAGLARAGVIGWWAVPGWLAMWFLAPMLGSMVGVVATAALTVLCGAPLVVLGVRMIRRGSPDVVAAGRAV
ncbi:hypothetical protein ND486_05760 [Pseudonocardia sp. DR1-2]|uniref:hypothetical protein n=1 Tax=Pseudonocardia sp. DR1-2 TaxID=2951168 RepID=UPI0020444A42|nr:hypothetical protein [Pseudonocardia sp. DR1-2]MCM3845703.1 hypothetical protein [Pseudonocardia sp. DR1-2]